MCNWVFNKAYTLSPVQQWFIHIQSLFHTHNWFGGPPPKLRWQLNKEVKFNRESLLIKYAKRVLKLDYKIFGLMTNFQYPKLMYR